MSVEESARKAALKNATEHEGKANPGAVIGLVMQLDPSARKDPKAAAQVIAKIVASVNKMSVDEQTAEYAKLGAIKDVVKKERGTFDSLRLPANFKVTSCFPPEPSKYPHIGHAKSALYNYLLAKETKGKFYLRFDDTNPDLAKKEFYDIILDNLSWLGIKPDKIIYASDFLKNIDSCAEELIKSGKAYVCDCPAEKMSELRKKKKQCEHISITKKDALTVFHGLREGQVLRLSLDMGSDNTTFRDPVIYRYIKKPHPRVKGRTKWPAYDFETAILDGLEKINFRIRGKEFELRGPLQREIQKLLKLSSTQTYEFARFEIKGATTSGREIRDGIADKTFIGWDDPSLVTLVALRRRGFQSEALKNFLLSTGLNKSESVLEWEDLYKHDKRLLDQEASRYFFISEPVALKVKGAPKQEVKLHLNPNKRDGKRRLQTGEDFFIEKKDKTRMKKGKLYRLMDCCNTQDGKYVKGGIDEFRGKGDFIMHFLPKTGNVNVEVFMPDKKVLKGIAESTIKNVKEGDVIQFERFGFCRLDDKKKMRFWFTHA